MDEINCDTCVWRQNGCDGEDVCERYRETEEKE